MTSRAYYVEKGVLDGFFFFKMEKGVQTTSDRTV